MLPDIGGHLYTCIDKLSGQPMFYANPSIKKAAISYRGAWAAFGIEFNFPVSHNWVSMSPVNYAYAKHDDGSASVTVGNIDRVYGMEWSVELILRPKSTVLEERITLNNRSDVRHRFYWWNKPASACGTTHKSFIPCAMQRRTASPKSDPGRSMMVWISVSFATTPAGRFLNLSMAAAKTSWECGIQGRIRGPSTSQTTRPFPPKKFGPGGPTLMGWIGARHFPMTTALMWKSRADYFAIRKRTLSLSRGKLSSLANTGCRSAKLGESLGQTWRAWRVSSDAMEV